MVFSPTQIASPFLSLFSRSSWGLMLLFYFYEHLRNGQWRYKSTLHDSFTLFIVYRSILNFAVPLVLIKSSPSCSRINRVDPEKGFCDPEEGGVHPDAESDAGQATDVSDGLVVDVDEKAELRVRAADTQGQPVQGVSTDLRRGGRHSELPVQDRARSDVLQQGHRGWQVSRRPPRLGSTPAARSCQANLQPSEQAGNCSRSLIWKIFITKVESWPVSWLTCEFFESLHKFSPLE